LLVFAVNAAILRELLISGQGDFIGLLSVCLRVAMKFRRNGEELHLSSFDRLAMDNHVLEVGQNLFERTEARRRG
jgi:hypothetical protein